MITKLMLFPEELSVVSLLPPLLPPILCLQKQSGTCLSIGMLRLKHNGGVSGNLEMSQVDKRTP